MFSFGQYVFSIKRSKRGPVPTLAVRCLKSSKVFIHIIFDIQSKRVSKESRIRESNINFAILSQILVSPKGSRHLGKMKTSANHDN